MSEWTTVSREDEQDAHETMVEELERSLAAVTRERDALRDMVHEDDAVAVYTLVQSVEDLKRSRDEWHDKCGDARADAADLRAENERLKALLRRWIAMATEGDNVDEDIMPLVHESRDALGEG